MSLRFVEVRQKMFPGCCRADIPMLLTTVVELLIDVAFFALLVALATMIAYRDT